MRDARTTSRLRGKRTTTTVARLCAALALTGGMTVGAVGVGFVGLGASPASATTVWQGRGSPFGRVLVPDPLRYCGLRALSSTWN